jgi:hypothetical protein
MRSTPTPALPLSGRRCGGANCRSSSSRVQGCAGRVRRFRRQPARCRRSPHQRRPPDRGDPICGGRGADARDRSALWSDRRGPDQQRDRTEPSGFGKQAGDGPVLERAGRGFGIQLVRVIDQLGDQPVDISRVVAVARRPAARPLSEGGCRPGQRLVNDPGAVQELSRRSRCRWDRRRRPHDR